MRSRLIPVLCLLLAPLGAQAQELRWDLEDEKVRYDRTATGEEPVLDPGPKLAAFKAVGRTDLAQGRTPAWPVEGPGDLLWRYALAVPKGQLPRKKRAPLIAEIADRFEIKGGELVAKGNTSVRRKGRARVTLRTSLVLTATSKEHWLAKGELLINGLFNLKRGRLEQADYELKITPRGAEQGIYRGRINTSRPPVRQDRPEFHTRVQAAIERGAGWLGPETKKRLAAYKKTPPGGNELGRVALPVFALLRSGKRPKDLERAFDWMRQHELRDTYSVALWIMVLEARYVQRKALPPRAHTRSVARFKRGQVPKADRDEMKKAVDWLIATRKHGEGWWSYYGTPGEAPVGHDGATKSKRGDRSNSQFAVLALHAALASGVKVPGEIWKEILDEVTGSQTNQGPAVSLAGSEFNRGAPAKRDPRDDEVTPGRTVTRKGPVNSLGPERLTGEARGWNYPMVARAGPGAAYGSMSAAGLSTVATAREGLRQTGRLAGDRRSASDTSMRDGLCWLLANFDPARNPNRGGKHYYYYAYSFEKAMDTAGIERLGNREWWRDFAGELLARQADDGSWGQSIESTSFALLVLNRATLPVQLDVGKIERIATGERDPSHWDLAVVEGVGQLSVRQILDLMIASPEEAGEHLPLARKALAALSDAQRPRIVPELRLLMQSPHRATKRWARESCKKLAGSDVPKVLDHFSRELEILRRANEGGDYGLVPEVRRILRAKASTVPLRRRALAAIGRLRALEAVEDVIRELGHGDTDYREFVWTYLISLTGAEHRPFAPTTTGPERAEQIKGWLAWWTANADERIEAEEIQREVRNLAAGPKAAKAAAKRLREIGEPALRGLVDGLRSEASKKRAHVLLEEISGETFPAEPDPWLDWLEQS